MYISEIMDISSRDLKCVSIDRTFRCLSNLINRIGHENHKLVNYYIPAYTNVRIM
jgi:hypothetical protein